MRVDDKALWRMPFVLEAMTEVRMAGAHFVQVYRSTELGDLCWSFAYDGGDYCGARRCPLDHEAAVEELESLVYDMLTAVAKCQRSRPSTQRDKRWAASGRF